MERKNIITALIKAQKEIRPPAKSGVNPQFKSKYATLDDVYMACREALAKNGLVLSHSVECEEGRYFLLTTLLHESGESISNKFPMMIEKQTNQGIASARTYACRYATCNLLALPSDEDDDGNAASLTHSQQKEIEQLIGGEKDLEDRIIKGYQSKLDKKIKTIGDIPAKEFGPIVRNLQARRQVAV